MKEEQFEQFAVVSPNIEYEVYKAFGKEIPVEVYERKIIILQDEIKRIRSNKWFKLLKWLKIIN